MEKFDENIQRTWEHIAEQVVDETDPQRVIELTRDLVRALDEQKNARPPSRQSK